MNSISDDELIMLCYENNEEARLLLYKKYQKVIYSYLRKYKYWLLKLNIDKNDLYNQCLGELEKAINSYSLTSEVSFFYYANLIISRKIKKELVNKSKRKMDQKNVLSLDYIYQDTSKTIEDYLINNNLNPFNIIIEKESYNKLLNEVNKILTEKELKIIYWKMQGYTYVEIANVLQENYKKIYLCVEKIRRKIKKIYTNSLAF